MIDQVRITSLNLRGFFDWEVRRPRIEAYLREVAPDVVLLQEVVFLPDVSAATNAEILADALGFEHRAASVTRLQTSPQYGVYREGLAVLSRTPIPRSEALVLHREERDPHERIVLLADVEAPDGPWRLADVHLSIRDDYAVHQLAEVLGILEARGERRVLAGDFNVNHLERHRSVWGSGWTLSSEVHPYVSFEASEQAEDYVLVPDGTRIAALELSGDGLSDHRAITVELERIQESDRADA